MKRRGFLRGLFGATAALPAVALLAKTAAVELEPPQEETLKWLQYWATKGRWRAGIKKGKLPDSSRRKALNEAWSKKYDAAIIAAAEGKL